MLTMNDLKTGTIIEFQNSIYQVLSKEFVRRAQGKPIVATKLKDLLSDKVITHSFQQSDVIKEANIEKVKAQFLYKDDNAFYFMDNKNFEQFSLPKKIVGIKENFLKEDTEIDILEYEEKAIDLALPVKMSFEVTSAPPDIKGNSVQAGTKEVEIETGYKIRVPLFIKEGDKIKINTSKGTYVERV